MDYKMMVAQKIAEASELDVNKIRNLINES